MKPVIGIIICENSENKQFVTETYIEIVIRSGGIPLIIPCPIFHLKHLATFPFHSFYQIWCGLCNGFLFCGGGDITPCLFDEPPLNSSGKTDLKIDLFQISLMEYILTQNIPILGICRGMQVLNVALGGTLYQDISLRKEPSYIHAQNTLSRNDVYHPVTFIQDSKLFNIYGNCTYTNSFHHQALHQLGSNLIISGQSEDGIIEAIESTIHNFAVGVQWHPECMYNSSKKTQKLFHTFIKSCTY